MMTAARSARLILLFAVALCWALPAAHAQIFEEQPMDFGSWIIPRNNTNYTITVLADGSYSSSGSLIQLAMPRPGIYRVEGLTAFAACGSVNVNMTQLMRGPPSAPTFTVDSFDVDCSPADVNGISWVTIGARAVTTGSGHAYGEGAYQGELSLVVNF